MSTTNNNKAILKFNNDVRDRLYGNVKSLKLFGSVARGTETIYSDIDILVLVEEEDSETDDILTDIMFNVNLEFNVVICPMLMSNLRYSNPLFQETSFYHSIESEGINL